MPTLLFANREAVARVLVQEALPGEFTSAPARAAIDADQRVWLHPAIDLTRETVAALARAQIPVFAAEEPGLPFSNICCWHQLVPLQPGEAGVNEQCPVLFEVPASQVGRLAAEVRQLQPTAKIELILDTGDKSALLRVAPAPYATLLRASSHPETRAFIQVLPRLWVQVGKSHPLAGQIRVPADRWYFLHADGWSERGVGSFTAEADQFRLRVGPIRLVDRQARTRLHLPMMLNHVPDTAPPDLWVVQDRAWEWLADLAQRTSSATLGRLRVALGSIHEVPTLVLWVKPSKHPAPEIGRATGYRPVVKLPNLYVPCGYTFSPMPRRDLLRQALASDPKVLTIALRRDDGRIEPVQVPIASFSPFDDAVEYQASRARVPLIATPIRPVFDFPAFAEHGATMVEPAKRAAPEASGPGWLTRLTQRLLSPSSEDEEPEEAPIVPIVRRKITSPSPTPRRKRGQNQRRAVLEANYLRTGETTGLAELASLHSQIGNDGDAALCWLALLWERGGNEGWSNWLDCEQKASRLTDDDWLLASVLAMPVSPTSLRLLAATVCALVQENPSALNLHLEAIHQRLEANGHLLPIRAAWLVSVLLSQSAGGDQLALTRARDRLLERLHGRGLSLELDVPAFIRFSGGDAGDRFQAVREWLIRVRDPMLRWVDQMVRHRPPSYCRTGPDDFPDREGRCTKALADLTLAWGLARLGDHQSARPLLESATYALHRGDLTTSTLAHAFAYRIEQALQSRPATGPIPDDLLAPIQADDPARILDRYRVDVLRNQSRILEPAVYVNPFRSKTESQGAWPADQALQRAAAALAGDPVRLLEAQRAIERALDHTGLTPPLESMLDRVPDDLTAVLLLAQMFATAGSRGDVPGAERLIPRLRRLFRGDGPRFGDLIVRLRHPLMGEDARGPDEMRRLEALPGYCLRDLRRLGLGHEADSLLLPAVEWVLHGKSVLILRRTQPQSWPSALRALLRLAGNWFLDKDDDRAITVLDAARRDLFHAQDLSAIDRASLAGAYAAALAHAPPRMALGRFDELFRDLVGLHDVRQTNSHYSLLPLTVVDATVRAALSDQFTLGPVAQRWLDEDEYRIRRRLFADL